MANDVDKMIADIVEARKTVAPYEKAFMTVLKEFVKTVRTFRREKSWYAISNKYVAVSSLGFIHIGMVEFSENEPGTVWIIADTGDETGEYCFTTDEIANPLPYLEKEFEKYRAEKEKFDERMKKKRREALLKELKELEN